MPRLLFLLSLLCVWTRGAAAQTTSAPLLLVPLGVGIMVPAFSMRDAEGKTRTLAGLRGRQSLLLTFFPRCFTGTCTSQLTSLRDAYPALQKAGVEVWAVSTDPADGSTGQRAFAKHLRLPFALLPDTDRAICLRFGAVHTREQMAARMSVLIDPTGRIVWIDKQISPRTHGADVLAKVRAQKPGEGQGVRAPK